MEIARAAGELFHQMGMELDDFTGGGGVDRFIVV
jgi:hypothetical protein